MSAPKILTSEQNATSGTRAHKRGHSATWTYLLALGIVLAIVGWTDVMLLWIPLNVGMEAWEFRTIGMTFEGLPLGTVGLALVGTGAIGRNLRVPRRILAVLFAVLAVGFLCIFLLYLLDIPLALQNVQEQVKPALKQNIFKTTIGVLAYTAFYSWSAWYLWRKADR